MGPLDVALVSLFAALTAVGAYVAIPLPFSPVPVTLQTLFVYLSGLVVGSRRGVLSQLVYLLLGTSGLPVFAGGRGGVGVIFGPTGGYLLGFVAGAYIAGLVAERRPPSFKNFLVASLLATAAIYALGVLQLMRVTGIGLEKALLLGAVPFLPGDSAKVLVAVWVALRVRKALPSIRGVPYV
ncbi:biotin transporter BioY [Infirmifilum lucidum]|uniref:Biotin transporter BioY n=1 Tax=Infirmifilum lucidum TaxID=2776706 RepID=A0A7L9FGW7_9CREN|nr:biotin transporter BioY [Infirmifilum lucidum]QOJ79050.1 biotin transporter BioY [Infirmifilum lucidum]